MEVVMRTIVNSNFNKNFTHHELHEQKLEFSFSKGMNFETKKITKILGPDKFQYPIKIKKIFRNLIFFQKIVVSKL